MDRREYDCLVERYPQLAHGGCEAADEGVNLFDDGIVLVVVVVVDDPGGVQDLGVRCVLKDGRGQVLVDRHHSAGLCTQLCS